MGFQKNKRPVVEPARRYTTLQNATAPAATIASRGLAALYSTSTVASTPTVAYVASPGALGDILDVNCNLASSSAGFVLRTSTSGVFIGSSSNGYDQVQFLYSGVGIRLVALSSTLFGVLGASTAASGSLPLLGVSTS